jgi:cytochrome c2
MLRLVTLVLTALGLTVSGALAQTPAQIERGQAVYAAERCSICHSIGETGNRRGPLDDVGDRLSADEIRLWFTDAPAMTKKTGSERQPAMRSYPNLSKEDLDGIVAYMLSLKK